MQKLVIGTRGSPLALAQTKLFQKRIQSILVDWTVDLQIIKTTGDAWALQNQKDLPPGKGIFTKELEDALFKNEIDLAVHSLKDLPVDNPPGLTIAIYPKRESPFDVLITRSETSILELPQNAVLATGSPRRIQQILQARPDLKIVDIRGNIDTRLRKLRENHEWTGIVLAQAGLNRLQPDLQGLVATPFPSQIMLPAPGQGSLGIQMRENDPRISLLQELDCAKTRATVEAERSFLKALGGGCAQPIASFASVKDSELKLEGFFSNGKDLHLRNMVVGSIQDPHSLGLQLAKKMISP